MTDFEYRVTNPAGDWEKWRPIEAGTITLDQPQSNAYNVIELRPVSPEAVGEYEQLRAELWNEFHELDSVKQAQAEYTRVEEENQALRQRYNDRMTKARLDYQEAVSSEMQNLTGKLMELDEWWQKHGGQD